MVFPQLSIRATLLIIIGVLNILIAILVGWGVYNSWVKFKEANTLMQGSYTINLLYKANKYLSLERAASLSVMHTSYSTQDLLRSDIISDREKSDYMLDLSLAQLENSSDVNLKTIVAQVKGARTELQKLRQELDVNILKSAEEQDRKIDDRIFQENTALIMKIRDLILFYEEPLRKIDPVVCQQMIAKYSVWEITEYAGREYAVIGKAIAENKPITPQIQENLLSWKSLIQNEWETTRRYAAGGELDKNLKLYLDEAETHYFLTFEQTKDIFYTSETLSPDSSYPLSIEMWLELASQAVDSLLALKDASLKETQSYVNSLERDARRDIIMNVLLFICAISVSCYCFIIILKRVIHPVNAMVNALYLTAQGLAPQKDAPIQHNYDEIRKLESVLKAFQENARRVEQSNVELERYAYITAHDLQSPLRAIDNLSQWIEEDLGEALTGKTREHMNTLRQRVRRMEKLLNDTLQYSRLDRQLQEKDSGGIVNGKNLIEDVISLAGAPKGFTFKIDSKFSSLNLALLPLQQVFYNLINNAVKHNETDKGIVEIGVREESEQYVFSVKDNGPGIPHQYHEKVFEMFQTLKSRDQKEGSGMGLAFVKKILATCGGTITLESEPGHGCLFRFTWPKPRLQ